jgi:hypothetical protein
MTHPTTPSQRAKRTGGYAKPGHDLITATECVALVEHRVAVLLAHYEAERRAARWDRRVWRLLTRRA